MVHRTMMATCINQKW